MAILQFWFVTPDFDFVTPYKHEYIICKTAEKQSWRPVVPLSNLSSMESYIEKLWAVCRCKVDTLKILFQFFHHNNGCLLTI